MLLLALMVGGAIAFSKTDGLPAQVLSCCGEVPQGFEESFDPKGVLNPGRMWAGL